jgi:hypothetical protein
MGFVLPDNLPADPEIGLCNLLAESDSDSAHSRYNALVRRLVIFESTAEDALKPLSSELGFRSLIEQIIRIDFFEGASAIRNDLRYL